jgi:hypothetical protein
MAILAQQYPVFQPALRIISNITNAFPAIVTTTFNHQYKSGTIVRLMVPQGYGMIEANQLFAPITIIDDTNFSIMLNTKNFTPFTTPMTDPDDQQYPQAIPVGEINSTLLASYQNVLPY